MATMAVDQYGITYHDLGPHPRAELLKRLGRKHAEVMYQDFKDGDNYWHARPVGWIIAGLWLSVYEVVPVGDDSGYFSRRGQ